MDRRNENLSSCGCGCGGDSQRHENIRATGYAAATETNDRQERYDRDSDSRQSGRDYRDRNDGIRQGEIKQSCDVAKDDLTRNKSQIGNLKDDLYGEKPSKKSEWNLYRDIDDLTDQ